ncbi:MAG: hypothetical protein K9N62_03195 [Verrucomicrobia bacterium]|nr:hypothetical protein [Verrucomicrobiota bacterium]
MKERRFNRFRQGSGLTDRDHLGRATVHRTNRKARLIVIAFLAFASTGIPTSLPPNFGCRTAESAPRLPTREELADLFRAAVKPPPRKVRLRVIDELNEPPAPEAEIESLLREIMGDLIQRRPSRTASEIEELRRVNLKSLRDFRDGHRVYDSEIWRSGPLYKITETQYSASASNLLAGIPDGEPVSKYTFANLDDPGFSEYVTYTVNHLAESATVSKNPKHRVALHEFWNARGMEPELAADLILAMADISTVKGLTRDRFDEIAIDPVKIDRLVRGIDQRLRVMVSGKRYQNHAVHQFDFVGVAPSPAERGRFAEKIQTALGGRSSWLLSQGIARTPLELFTEERTYQAKATYIVDSTNYHRLYKATVEVTVPKISYVSERKEFNEEDFPRFWTITKETPEKSFETHRLQFLEVDLQGRFDDRDVFALSAPISGKN